MSELKPCPFCESNDVEYYNGWAFGDRNKDDSDGREPSICCHACGIGFINGYYGRGVSDEYAMKRTLAAWNHRVCNIAGECTKCGEPVYRRPGKPGEYNHECSGSKLVVKYTTTENANPAATDG